MPSPRSEPLTYECKARAHTHDAFKCLICRMLLRFTWGGVVFWNNRDRSLCLITRQARTPATAMVIRGSFGVGAAPEVYDVPASNPQ
jgi:hypothetical protein